jgi:glycosyltransferase involved in cell wall biosynthesis
MTTPPKTILVVINNFPSQFKSAVNSACDQGWNVFSTCHQVFLVDHHADQSKIRFVNDIAFNPINTEANVTHFTNAVMFIRDSKIVPDVILVHVGFGIERTCRYFFPNTPIVGYCEWYFKEDPKYDIGRRVSDIVKNHGIRNQLDVCDYLVSPTRVQRNQYPAEYRKRIMLLHEGVDTQFWIGAPTGAREPLRRDADDSKDAQIIKSDSLQLSSPIKGPTSEQTTAVGARKPLPLPLVVTYVSRGLEPTRKFMEFIRGLKLVLETDPNVIAKIVGKDQVYYSDHTGSYLKLAKEHLGEDLCKRVTFTLDIPKAKVLEIMQSSDVHVYFTEDFVPSWSMIEAMSCGCFVVASDCDSCREFIEHEVHGFLVDHNNPEVVKNAILKALRASNENREIITTNARNKIVNEYCSRESEKRWGIFLNSI